LYIDGIEETVEILRIPGLPEDAYALSDVLTDHFSKGKKVGHLGGFRRSGGRQYPHRLPQFFLVRQRPQAGALQAGRPGGIGTVFADKGIKAVVARWEQVSHKTNHPADLEAVKTVARCHAKEIVELDPKQNEMARIGTTHLVPIMNDFDLLPTKNFQYGSDPRASLIGRDAFEKLFDPGFDGCWMGCTVACAHGVKDFVPYDRPLTRTRKGVRGRPEYETIAGCGSNLGIFDPFTILEINFYCDAYGLDTISVGTGHRFCHGVLRARTDQHGAHRRHGSVFRQPLNALELVHQMALGKGFGAIFGQGIRA
jgi:aldehyde:ferredoxin oxidoreductase